MDKIKLGPETSALLLIDLQHGIVALETRPQPACGVVAKAAHDRLAKITRLLSQETVPVEDSHPRWLFNCPPIGEIPASLLRWQSRLFNDLRVAPQLPFKRRKL